MSSLNSQSIQQQFLSNCRPPFVPFQVFRSQQFSHYKKRMASSSFVACSCGSVCGGSSVSDYPPCNQEAACQQDNVKYNYVNEFLGLYDLMLMLINNYR